MTGSILLIKPHFNLYLEQPVLRATRVKLLKKTAGALMGLKFTLTDDESDALPIMHHTRVVLDSCLTDN